MPSRQLSLLILVGTLTIACSQSGFDDDDYVRLTVDISLIGSSRHPGGGPPTDPAQRRAWHREEVDALLAEYGITENDYLEYSRALHDEPARYNGVLDEIAEEFQRRDEELEDTEAPEEVKPPPGSFG